MSYQTARIWLGAIAVLAVGLTASTMLSAEGEKPESNPFAVKSDLVRTEFDVAPSEIQYRFPLEFQAATVAGVRNGVVVASAADSIRKSAEAVRDAKDDEEKRAAQSVLDERLSKYFDDDMTQREGELAKIEERLTKLRELLERRRAKKQEIVELQAKVALNEADGLGFYNTEHPSKSASGGGFGFSNAATSASGTVLPRMAAPASVEVLVPTSVPAKKPGKPAKPAVPPAPPTAPSEPGTPF